MPKVPSFSPSPSPRKTGPPVHGILRRESPNQNPSLKKKKSASIASIGPCRPYIEELSILAQVPYWPSAVGPIDAIEVTSAPRLENTPPCQECARNPLCRLRRHSS